MRKPSQTRRRSRFKINLEDVNAVEKVGECCQQLSCQQILQPKKSFGAAGNIVACLPWPRLKPTELDLEIWRVARRREDLQRDISAIEDQTGIEFNPEDENYKNILGVVAQEDELCRGVDNLHSGLRNISLEIIRGHYLQKEFDRLTKDLQDLLALRQSGGDYKGQGNKLPPKKLH